MARMTTDGISQLAISLDQISEIPDDVLEQMLQAEADVIEKAQREKGKAYGVHRTGVTLSSIERTKTSKTKDGKAIYIMPMGTNADGNRNAEVAFINEYGKHGQPARPFIRDANEEKADEAVDAAAAIYDNYLSSKGL